MRRREDESPFRASVSPCEKVLLRRYTSIGACWIMTAMKKQQTSPGTSSGREVADKVLNERIRQARKEEVLEIYEELLQTIWTRILPTLGRVTVMAIMERAITLTKENFPIVERLKVSPEGLLFDDLRSSMSESDLEVIREALRELVADLIDILAMLTGDVLVQQLIKEIDGRHKS